jgi:hypothetical protein
MADRQSPTTAETVILVAGGVMVLFSFLHFTGTTSAWGRGWFPIATLLPLYGLVMAAQIALTRFAAVRFPRSVLGFTWEQLHMALGAMAGLMAMGWLMTDTGHKQFGQWFEILGGIALVAGAVMLQSERHTGAI